MTLKKKKKKRDREKTWGFQESSVAIKEIKALFYPEYDEERKRAGPSLLSLIKSCAASGIRKRQQCPELHPERKTHSRPDEGIYNTHS